MKFFYISDEDYAVGLSNGLSKKIVYQRVYSYDWTVEDAITKPKLNQTEGLWPKWKDKATCTMSTFYRRIRTGATPEEAALGLCTPKKPKPPKYKEIPNEIYERAFENGITRTVVYYRVNYYFWSHELACTTPVLNHKERLKRGRGRKCQN